MFFFKHSIKFTQIHSHFCFNVFFVAVAEQQMNLKEKKITTYGKNIRKKIIAYNKHD